MGDRPRNFRNLTRPPLTELGAIVTATKTRIATVNHRYLRWRLGRRAMCDANLSFRGHGSREHEHNIKLLQYVKMRVAWRSGELTRQEPSSADGADELRTFPIALEKIV